MADELTLSAELRTDMGKGASRRLRRLADKIPAVIYGVGKEAVSLQIAHKDIYKALENEAFYSSVISLSVAGETEQAVLKALQRHPAKDRIMHADFMRVRMDVAITALVPIHFINEEACAGVKLGGGQVSRHITSVEVSCLPGDLPSFIEVDLESLEVGDSVHYSELVLPEGVTIPVLAQGDEHDQAVVSVNTGRGVVDEVDAPDAEEGDAAEADGDADADDGDSED